MKRLAAYLPLLPLLILGSLLVFWLRNAELAETMEAKTLDWRFRNFSDARRHDPRIVLVVLDQQSLDAFEQDQIFWPWPRSLYGAVLDFLKAGGARLVVFDMLYTTPSPYGRSEDAEFARSLAASVKTGGPKVVLAMEMSRKADPLRSSAPEPRFALELGGGGEPEHGAGKDSSLGAPGALPSNAVTRDLSARVPIPLIRGAVAALGDTAQTPDADGVFRRVALVSEMGGRLYPGLAAAAALALSKNATVTGGAESLTLGDYRVPLTDGRLLVRFHGSALAGGGQPRLRTYKAYPAGELIQAWQNLQEQQPAGLSPSEFKGKIVFVGVSAPGLMDNRPSPVSEIFPGTEILAAAVDNIVNGDFLRRAPGSATYALILFFMLAAGAAACLPRSVWTSGAAAGLLSFAAAGLAVEAFRRGVWLDLVGPQLGVWLGYAAASAFGYAVEGRQKKFIQNAFAHYLSPEIVARIAEDPKRLALGGKRRELTCFFSDVAGFTTISESLPPDVLARLMNRYLGEMTDILLAHGGTLDKYIGDAIMAFWGAPELRDDQAAAACRAALACQEALARLRREFSEEGLPAVHSRIGINSGPASVGNMGSSRRFSYTALGDAINLASRLEGANKAYGSRILISEFTRAAAGTAVETRELDSIKVIGKNKPVRVYELLGIPGATDSGLLKKARRFEAALQCYRDRLWTEAAEGFGAVALEFGGDEASAAYLERCRHFRQSPPPPDWDGTWALKEK